MSQRWAELLAPLPDYLGGHVLLSVASLLAGLAVSLPLGIVASRRPKLAELILGVASVVQTVPTVALLVLMVPLLGGAIGFLPSFIALTLYAILPILSNTVVGIRGVDPALTEAARGLGMSDRQVLFRVQLPLGLPVIIGGVRTATVLVVGTATLATPVGGTSLGNYIFSGLEMNNMTATVFGCVLAALLAVVLDQLVRRLEVAARMRDRRTAGFVLVALVLVLGGGLCGPALRLLRPRPVVVAGAPFTEQHILSEVMRSRLESAGFGVRQCQGMGETILFLALRSNKVDCCVNYTGNVWATLMGRDDVADPQAVYDQATRYLKEEYGVECLGRLGFANAYVLAMQKDKARGLGIATIDDLGRHAPGLTLAGDLQFFGRPEWARVREAYRLAFKSYRGMDPSLMYRAVMDGDEVQVVCAYSSDGRILAGDLVILEDTRAAFPPYDAILLLSPAAAARAEVREALLPLVGTFDLGTMQKANGEVDIGGRQPGPVARELAAKLWPRRGR